MKNYIFISFAIAIIVLSTACKKQTPAYDELTSSKENALIYITKTTGLKQNLSIFPFIDEAKTANFRIAFGAVGLPKNNIQIDLAFDQKAFDSLNVIRQSSGLQPYLKFPADSYKLNSSNPVIEAGKVNSEDVTISYFSKKFDPTKDYLLPLTITNANGYQIGKAKTIFFIAPKVEEVRAATTGWVATASSEQPAGENTGKASALLDSDLTTIWHAQYSPAPAGVYPYVINFDMLNPISVTKIAIAPRQNNGNGPTLFKVEGSLNGTSWSALLDNQVFDPNKRDGTYQNYPLSAPTSLRYIRVTLLQGRSNLSFLSEIAIFRY